MAEKKGKKKKSAKSWGTSQMVIAMNLLICLLKRTLGYNTLSPLGKNKMSLGLFQDWRGVFHFLSVPITRPWLTLLGSFRHIFSISPPSVSMSHFSHRHLTSSGILEIFSQSFQCFLQFYCLFFYIYNLSPGLKDARTLSADLYCTGLCCRKSL